MRIGIDLERLRNLNSGLGQFCWHLYSHIYLQKPADFDFDLYLPNKLEWHSKAGETVHRVREIDKVLGIRSKDIDLFHATHQDTRLLPGSKKIAQLLTIHDLNFLEKYKDSSKIKTKLKALQSKVDRASGISFISEYTKSIAFQHLQIPDAIPNKIIHNGNNIEKEVEAKKPDWLTASSYFFTIGMIQPKKNFHALLPIMKHFNTPLVIAGGGNQDYVSAIQREAREMEVAHLLIMPGAISDAEKKWLFGNALAFLFPSLAEGFGLPVVEAMNFGLPVFLSNLSSLPEIGGEQAFYWSTFDAGHMIDVVSKGLNYYQANKTLKDGIIERSKYFSWDRAAKEYLTFYQELLK